MFLFVSSGIDGFQLYKQLCVAIQPTEVHDVLDNVEGSKYEMFFHKYLHDFVRLFHKCESHEKDFQQKEYKVTFLLRGTSINFDTVNTNISVQLLLRATK